MAKLLPQEIEVRYLIPALRRELSKILSQNHNLKQKEVATLLGLTEAAISQYIKEVRGQEMKFDEKELKIISDYAKKMIAQPEKSLDLLFKLSVVMRGSTAMCGLHKSMDSDLPDKCTLCRE
jgi:predicted transcriptional regulator